MASPVGLRPIWHMLKRTRPIPTSTLLHSSRSFASQKNANDELTQPPDSVWNSREKNKDLGGEDINGLGKQGEAGYDLEDFELLPHFRRNAAGIPVRSILNKPGQEDIDHKRLPSSVLEKSVQAGAYPEIDLANPSPPGVRYPRSVQAVYLRPLRREAKYGVPCCDLQLRSYSVRSLEFFADFALRAAYYLHLPAYGPVPLPRITQRWTVPKSNFIFKKSQENFERITLRRLIQIKDGHPETVELWLAFLRKHQHHGVGMKANVWEYEKIGVGKEMDVKLGKVADEMAPEWGNFGRQHNVQTAEKVMELMNSEKYRQARGHSPN